MAATEEKTYEIVVCANAETICDGWVDTDDDFADEVYGAAIEVLRVHAKADQVNHEFDRIFQNWHGGKYARAGESVGGIRWGYHSYKVATLEVDPPQWLCDLIDEMSCAMEEKAIELAETWND